MASNVPSETSMPIEKVLLGSKWFRGMKTLLGKCGNFEGEAAQRQGRFLETELGEPMRGGYQMPT